ncbi:MAG: helix-hairpin-helix domain-containing protein [Chitinophagaceae bacterium]|nr:helix-hairpin-helix domain-containing protein [Chitinophagaceae bacterium]
MNPKKLIQDYFHFTRNDRAGILVILAVMLGVILLPELMEKRSGDRMQATGYREQEAGGRQQEAGSREQEAGSRFTPNSETYSGEQEAGGRQQGTGNWQLETGNKAKKGELFYFDPNQLDRAGWTRLGLRDKTIGIILNYVSKGGHFRKKEDLQRIYGLHPDEYSRLAPWVRISEVSNPETKYSPTAYTKTPAMTREKTIRPVDINQSDTTAWISLPGIGSKLASRIILFREKLGGFYSVDQVGETFGLADSVFRKIKTALLMSPFNLRKININTATVEQLKSHPYIRYELARPVIAYREQHGLYKQLNELIKIPGITEARFQQLVPYLKLDDLE